MENYNMPLPDWIIPFKRTGCEIKCISGKYYLYELKSYYDPVTKTSRKKSGAYLGAITPEGIVPKRIVPPASFSIATKEFGVSAFLLSLSKDIRTVLNETFENTRISDSIYVASLLRVLGTTAFKRMEIAYEKSFISELIPNIALSSATISSLINHVGMQRDRIVDCMNNLSDKYENIIVDGSRITSWSDNMFLSEIGYIHKMTWTPQINIIYIFSREENPEPIFYRCVSGNVPDIKALKLTLESLNKDLEYTLIADTGFVSAENFNLLDGLKFKYIIPLKRNSVEITHEMLEFKNYTKHFVYHDRAISAQIEKRNEYNIVIFRDETRRSIELVNSIIQADKNKTS
jgi:hypothetical protein